MSRRRRSKGESKTDDSWLLPYSDMLTLLLALFIVLFAMSEVDVKKFEKLASIFQTEFNNGGGVVDMSSSIIPEDVPVEENQEKEKEKEENVDILAVQEYQKLKQMQEEVDKYITTNSLTET